MTENISPDAASRRESARTTSGQFGTQPRSEADLDLDVVRAALPAGPETTYHQFTYADLASFDDRRDDPTFFDDPDTLGARKRLSVLATAFAARDMATRHAAVPDVLALYDVPGGVLEGRSEEMLRAAAENKFGYPTAWRFVDTSTWYGKRTGLREEYRTVLAALTESHLRSTDPAPFGDARDLNIHPDQYQPEEMTADELAEVHRRLTVSKNFSTENTDAMIDEVRKATRGTTLRGVHACEAEASKLADEFAEVGLRSITPELTAAGDPTGQVQVTTPGGRTLLVSDHGVTGPAGYQQHRYEDRAYGLRQEIRLAATADVLRDLHVGDETLHDAAVRDREQENGDGIGFVPAGEKLHPRDWYAEPEQHDMLFVQMRITDNEEALVQRVLVTETGVELEDYRGFPEMGQGLLAGRDRVKGLPVGTHAAALRHAHTRLINDPDVKL